MDLVPDFKGQIELDREIPNSACSHNLILDRLRKLIDHDDEKQHRIQQEEAFSRQLGTAQPQKGMAGKAEEPTPKVSPGTPNKKQKEQMAQKDRQISALAGQLKHAG